MRSGLSAVDNSAQGNGWNRTIMQWMGIQDIATFTIAVLVFLALPGPGTLTLLGATSRGGVRAFLIGFGFKLGLAA